MIIFVEEAAFLGFLATCFPAFLVATKTACKHSVCVSKTRQTSRIARCRFVGVRVVVYVCHCAHGGDLARNTGVAQGLEEIPVFFASLQLPQHLHQLGVDAVPWDTNTPRVVSWVVTVHGWPRNELQDLRIFTILRHQMMELHLEELHPIGEVLEDVKVTKNVRLPTPNEAFPQILPCFQPRTVMLIPVCLDFVQGHDAMLKELDVRRVWQPKRAHFQEGQALRCTPTVRGQLTNCCHCMTLVLHREQVQWWKQCCKTNLGCYVLCIEPRFPDLGVFQCILWDEVLEPPSPTTSHTL